MIEKSKNSLSGNRKSSVLQRSFKETDYACQSYNSHHGIPTSRLGSSSYRPNHLPRRNSYLGDRYMPSRVLMEGYDYDYRLSMVDRPKYSKIEGGLDTENILDKVYLPTNGRIFKIMRGQRSPSPAKKMRMLLEHNRLNPVSPAILGRHVRTNSERTYDAPNISHRYVNLVDWGKHNDHIALAVEDSVFVMMGKEVKEITCCSPAQVSAIFWLNMVPPQVRKPTSRLLLGGVDGAIYMFSLGQDKVLKKFSNKGATQPPNTAVTAFATYRSKITAGFEDGRIIFYDYNGDFICENHVHDSAVFRLKWCKMGRYLASVSQRSVKITNFDHIHGDPCPVPGVTGFVTDAEWSLKKHSQLFVASGTNCRTLSIIDYNTGLIVQSILLDSKITCLLSSGLVDEVVVAVGPSPTEEFNLLLVHGPTLKTLTRLLGHTDQIISIRPNPSGDSFCSLALDESLRIYKAFPEQASTNKKHQKSKPLRKRDEDMERMMRAIRI